MKHTSVAVVLQLGKELTPCGDGIDGDESRNISTPGISPDLFRYFLND